MHPTHLQLFHPDAFKTYNFMMNVCAYEKGGHTPVAWAA
jgi:hypothetical protein